MARRSRERTLPPYCTRRPQGGFRLQILDPDTGERVRPRDLLATEPAFYATQSEVWVAHDRLTAVMAMRLERGATLRGFWEDWTNPDDWYWGTAATDRKVQSLATIKVHTKGFVDFFTEDDGQTSPRINAITTEDVERWLKTLPAQSNIPIVSRMFAAAVERKLRVDNPIEEAGKRARKTQHEKRQRRERLGDNKAPEPHQIDELLDELGNSARYPYGLYAWFKIATAVGMRSGELDAMRISKLDLTDPSKPLYLIDEQYHSGLNIFTDPKHDSVRTIRIPQVLLPVLERCAWEAEHKFGGSPFFFHTSRGEHWRNSARAYYWNDEDKHNRVMRTGLRRVVDDVSMYCATRAFFATQAVLSSPDQIPMIAKHYGHKDNGKVLLRFYTRLTDRHGQDGMDVVYGRLHADEPVRLADRRKAA